MLVVHHHPKVHPLFDRHGIQVQVVVRQGEGCASEVIMIRRRVNVGPVDTEPEFRNVHLKPRTHDGTSTVQVVYKPKGGLNGVLNRNNWPLMAVLDFDVAGILAGPLNDAVWVGQMSAVPELQVHVIH